MKPAQALDFGLNICGVLLLFMFVLLAAQAEVLTSEPGPALELSVERTSPSVVVSGPGFRGSVDEVRPALVALCAVTSPPSLRLTFPTGTLLSDAHDAYSAINALPDVVCPLSY